MFSAIYHLLASMWHPNTSPFQSQNHSVQFQPASVWIMGCKLDLITLEKNQQKCFKNDLCIISFNCFLWFIRSEKFIIWHQIYSDVPNKQKKIVYAVPKEVCNWGVACSQLDGGWQAMPSITKFLDIVDLYVVHSHLRMWAALKKAVFFQKKKIKLKTF